MALPDNDAFLRVWPTCLIMILTLIELFAIVILLLTELCNVAASFWTTNVFAGGWCGLVMFIHFIFLLVTECCLPGPKAAFRTLIVTFVGIVATALLISFDAVFIAQPSTCILTSSCAENAASNTTFSYNFQQSFYNVFTSRNPFQSFGVTQIKLLCQAIQIAAGCLCFIICVIYVIIYYVCLKKAKSKIKISPSPEEEDDPASEQQDDHPSDQQNHPPSPVQQVNSSPLPPQQVYPPQQSYPIRSQYGYPPPAQQGYPPPPVQQGYYPPPVQQGYYPPPPQLPYYQPPPPIWSPPVQVSQPRSGTISWIAVRKR